MIKKTTYFILFLFALTSTSIAQEVSKSKIRKEAKKAMEEQDWELAKEKYAKLVKLFPESAVDNFECGLSIFLSEVQPEKSIEYFEQAISKFTPKDSIYSAFYYLAKAYHISNEFDKAIENYEKFKVYTKNSSNGTELSEKLDDAISMCENGKAYTNSPSENVTVENIGSQFNSIQPEYNVFEIREKNAIIYTSRAATFEKDKTHYDGLYRENVFYSQLSGEGKLVKGKSVNDVSSFKGIINTIDNEAVVDFNETTKDLYISRKGKIYKLPYDNGKWGELEELDKTVFNDFQNTSVCVSENGKKMLFVAKDKRSSNKNIYYIDIQEDGSLSKPILFEVPINSEYDEESPYLTDNDSTLYFSSNRMSSMGGYDIYKSTLTSDGKWTEPENLGSPINSSSDDLYYRPKKDEEYVLFSSNRLGSLGHMDIYKAILECRNIEATKINGLLVSGDMNIPTFGEIEITDANNNLVGVFYSDSITGEFLLKGLSPEKNYTYKVTAENYSAHTEPIYLPKQCEEFDLYQTISVNFIKDSSTNVITGQRAEFTDAFFDIESSASKYFGFNDFENDNTESNLVGMVSFGDGNLVSDALVYLVNDNNEVIDYTMSNEKGYYSFNTDSLNKYSIAFNLNDLNTLYYGKETETNNFAIHGSIYKDYSLDNPLDGIEVLIINDNLDVLYADTTINGKHSLLISENESIVISLDNNYSPSNKFGWYENYLASTDSLPADAYLKVHVNTIELAPEQISLPGFNNIYFGFDSFVLSDNSKKVLDSIYSFMTENKDVNIEIDGYTCNIGAVAYNKILSERRSQAAKKYLMEKGISKERIDGEWFGEDNPYKPNNTTANRKLNRRVEFKISRPNTTSAESNIKTNTRH